MFQRVSMLTGIALLAAVCTGCAARSDTADGSDAGNTETSGVIATPLAPDPVREALASSATPSTSPQTSATPKIATAEAKTSSSQMTAAKTIPVKASSPKTFEGRPVSPVAPKNPAPAKPAPTSEQGDYAAALAAYNAHQPEEAIRRFDAFITAYPDSKLMPNALYWKAECLYFQEKYPEAIFLFKDVTARFPRHPKAADALLKAGMSYAHLGDTDNAKLHYRVLSEDYPQAQATRKGKELLGQ